MRHLRMRFFALLMSLVMAMTLLPGTAYAALGDLLLQNPAVNAELLAQLSDLTGMDEASLTALLEAYDLVDGDGQLKISETLDFNGVPYTLEGALALLEDPATDLDATGTVDGVPIRLGDLKTAIQIELALRDIRDNYFSGRTFSDEALENLNSFLDQAAATGVTLLAEGARETVPYEPFRRLTLSDFDTVAGYSAGTTFKLSGSSYMIGLSAGETISMDVTYDPGMLVKGGQPHPQTVEIGFTSGNWGGDKDFKEGWVTFSGDELSQVTTKPLTYTGDGTPVRMLIYVTPYEDTSVNNVTPYAYGDLYGAVHLTGAQGFVFEKDGKRVDSHTILIRKPTNEE